MTKPKRYKRYSAEFKKEAIRRATEEAITDKAVCDELGINSRQFRRWRDEPQELRRITVWSYDWQNAPPFDVSRDQALMDRIAQYLDHAGIVS